MSTPPKPRAIEIWYPSKWSEIVGNRDIKVRWKNMIQRGPMNTVISGPNGSGKTRMSLLGLRSMLCRHRINDLDPCGQCDTCRNSGGRMSSLSGLFVAIHDAACCVHMIDCHTWTSLDEAVESANRHDNNTHGIGFVFTEDDPFVGVDLDDCRNPVTGQLDPWSLEVIEKLASYTEVSPSKTGAKAILTTDAKIQSRRRSNPGLEVYRSSRFFTITGDIVGLHPEANDATDALNWIYDRYFPDLDPVPTAGLPNSQPMTASDQDVVNKALSARNGSKFRDLWTGSTKTSDGNKSEADLSLCRLLAFWCGPCQEQIDRLFRGSGLFRSKWDTRHFSSGATYGMETIRKAILAQGDVFYRWPENRISP